jgi:hypothetical protein
MKRILALLLLAAAAPDPVVAVRGNDSLTASQVRALIAASPAETQKQIARNPDALTTLIRDTLLQHAILAEAAAQHWDQKPAVAALLARTRETAILQSFLAAQGQIPAGFPTDADIQAAYDHEKAHLLRPRAYHLAEAFQPLSAASPAGAQAEAMRKLNQLRREAARTPLEAAAKRAGLQYADLGWVAEPNLQKAAKEAVSGLLEGQLSDPVCTANGCTLLKLIATRPAGPPALPEVRDQLILALRQQKQQQQAQAYASGLLAKQPVRMDEIQLSHLAGQ